MRCGFETLRQILARSWLPGLALGDRGVFRLGMDVGQVLSIRHAVLVDSCGVMAPFKQRGGGGGLPRARP
eukprot:scaffold79785_cov32-Tisochrysis_lutea.AAC.2